MPYALAQVARDNIANYSVFSDFFSADECKKIVDDHKNLPVQIAQVGEGSKGTVDKKKRISDIRWINWEANNEWLFARLAEAITMTNAKWFGYHLAGLNEPLQLTHYKSKRGNNGHYTWHEDRAHGGAHSFRKLSFIIPLNEGFSGGNFRMLHNEVPEQKRGTLIVFPSFATHCVEPVTKGERWSLVGWVTGPAFV